MVGGADSKKRALAGSGWRWLACVCLALIAGAAASQSADPPIIATIDPLTIADDDFARNRDPEVWRDLAVQQIVFTEASATWRLWRIANTAKPAGPLWVVTHDNENATFAAALTAVKSWGGVVMVVDTGPVDTRYDARFNAEVVGKPIDPNRNFLETRPVYVARMLADLGDPARLIIALHTNAPDFDPNLSDCPALRPGRGAISVGLCNSRYQPRPAAKRQWPFDDEDSLMLLPHLNGQPRASAPCGRLLASGDYNLVFERVGYSDGSLSNYAAQHGLAYVNVETEERGSSPTGIALARDRLVDMIDKVMQRCGPVPGVALRVPRR